MTQTNETPTAHKPDNLLGICHAVGQAFGFNPLILRMVFVFAMLASAKYTILAYLGLGVAVSAAALIERLRSRRRARPAGLTLVHHGDVPAAARAEPEALAA